MIKIYACTGAGSSVLCICKKWSKNQDKPRNYIQERPTLIYAYYVLYMWEECKQTQCPHRSWRERTTTLMWYYSPTKKQVIKFEQIFMIFGFLVNMEIQKQYILFPLLGSFPWKNDALPMNSLFWSPPTAVHRFDAWNMTVPGLYISWYKRAKAVMYLKMTYQDMSGHYLWELIHLKSQVQRRQEKIYHLSNR